MRFSIVAALALAAASPLPAQTATPSAPPIPDLATATPIGGTWSWAPTADGSEAVFTDAYAKPQLTVHCTRVTRRVSFVRPATAAAPYLGVWTSSQSRNLPASFEPATARLKADVPGFDALLDAFATSRGRVGIVMGTAPPLVVPAWAEVARVIEDCRV